MTVLHISVGSCTWLYTILFQSTCVCPVYLLELSRGTLLPLSLEASRVLDRKGYNIAPLLKTNPAFTLVSPFCQLPLPRGKATSHPWLSALSSNICVHIQATFIAKLPSYLREAIARELEEFPGHFRILVSMTQYLVFGQSTSLLQVPSGLTSILPIPRGNW